MTLSQQDRLDNWKLHESQRGYFSKALYRAMAENDRIWLVTADLGFGVLDPMRDDFDERFLNTGASEQVAMGICVGLALEGKIPFLYSITSFLLYRPFEWIRNYLNHEQIPVKLVGSGFGDDYKHDGFTHHTYDAKRTLALFPCIQTFFPDTKEQVPDYLKKMIENDLPSFLCLRR